MELIDLTALDHNDEDEKVLIQEGAEEDSTPSYYQRSISAILESVAAIHENILLEEEMTLIRLILNLERDAQRLLYRLFLRRQGWFRVQKLVYKDVPDINGACRVLRTRDLLDCESEDMSVYLDLLGLEELKDFCKKRKLLTSGQQNKREHLVKLIKNSPIHKQQTLSFGRGGLSVAKASSHLDLVQALCGPIVRIQPNVYESMKRLTGLYFAASASPSNEDSLATAILSDLKRRNYPVYEIVRSGPLFGCREDWLGWEAAQVLYNSLWARLEAGDDEELLCLDHYVSDVLSRWTHELTKAQHAVRRYFLRRLSSAWTYTKCLHILADALEKAKEHLKAAAIYECLLEQDLFCLGRRGQWYERLALILHKHLKHPDEAVAFCKRALDDSHVRTSSRLALRRRLTKLEKSEEWEEFPIEEVQIEGTPQASGVTGRRLVFAITEDISGSVEDLVLYHFVQTGGWKGLHTESSVYSTLFGLLLWDIIFAPVPDVFQSPFQACPLDFSTDAFYEARKDLIGKRLLDIAAERHWKDELVEAWNTRHGQICIGVAWEAYELDQLWSVMRAVGGPALSAILRTLAEDYKHSRSGMPDLILWRDDLSVPGRLEHLLVEVKSARDRLSDAQRHWASIFLLAGVKMVVCKVKHV